MKEILFIIFCVPCFCFGQKLEENKVDEFTKAFVKRTSWETINFSNNFLAYSRISKIDNIYYLDVKVTLSDAVFSIEKDDKLMIKTVTDSIITIFNLKYQISCTGCGAKGLIGSGLEGIEVSYPIPSEMVLYLLTNKIKALRLYTTDGYVEHDIKDKNAQTFIKQLKLVN